MKDPDGLSVLKGKYLHELTDDEVHMLLDAKIEYTWVRAFLKQPEWCTYPDAMQGKLGCWSLTDLFGRRKRISRKFCLKCDAYEEI